MSVRRVQATIHRCSKLGSMSTYSLQVLYPVVRMLEGGISQSPLWLSTLKLQGKRMLVV